VTDDDSPLHARPAAAARMLRKRSFSERFEKWLSRKSEKSDMEARLGARSYEQFPSLGANSSCQNEESKLETRKVGLIHSDEDSLG
jgi:hypothetical protein